MEYDYVEAMSAFEGLQIKPTYIPIDIRLTVSEITDMLREKNLYVFCFLIRLL